MEALTSKHVALLQQIAAFETVSSSAAQKQVRVVGRVDRNRQSFWTTCVHHLLKTAATSGGAWTCDISRQFIMQDNQLRYAWRIILQGQDPAVLQKVLLNALESAPRPGRVEIESMLLPGYKPGQTRDGVNAKGKGAQSSLNAVVGPMAAQRLQRGGQ